LSTLPQHQLVDLLLTATVRHPELPFFPPNVRNLIPNPGSQYQAQQQRTFHNPSATNTPHFSTHSSLNPAEAQLLGETSGPRTTIDLAGNQYEEDDGYDTDPPAHYVKPGNGLARTLRPESEDLNWLVDDNFEVFSHGWKGDGTGMGADGTLDGGQKVA
jgi:hypothetical protein